MREKFKRFWDTANPDLLRLVIIFVLVGLLLAGFLLFGHSGDGGSVLPAWAQTKRVEPPDERLAAAQKENPDTVAWITIPGTNIDAPVQQYGDNDYYLRHLLDSTWNDNGSIFMDCSNKADFSDQNSLIYGHNMTSGAMFSNLVKYKKQAYYDQHPYLYMLTPQQNYKLRLFAGVIVDAAGYILDSSGQVAYPDCSVYQFQVTQEFLQQMVNYSTFRSTTGVPSADSHIVTLSTCTYEFKNVRYVVLGVLEPIQ